MCIQRRAFIDYINRWLFAYLHPLLKEGLGEAFLRRSCCLSRVRQLVATCRPVGCHVSASWLPRVGQLVVTCRPVGCHVSADVLKVTLKEQQRPTCLAFLFQTYVCPFCKFTKTFLSIHGWTIIFSDYSLFRINLPTFASRIINY